MNRNILGAITLVWAFAAIPLAVAQQDKGSQMSGMQGHNMGSMDMQGMMNQCTQMKAGARMSADAKKMMRQCDQMDQQMGNMSNGSKAPHMRTR